MNWLRDDEFIRDTVPMTKYNIRILSLSYLDLKPGDKFLDIGSGSGSISVQAEKLGAEVTAIESNDNAYELSKKNRDFLNTNFTIIHGLAPEDLPNQRFSKVFLGGSRGNMKSIFDYLEDHLKSGGVFLGNFIRFENAGEFYSYLKEYGYESLDLQLIQSSSIDSLGLLRGENPIFIIRGIKR